jgi:hypothetical protein
LGVIITAFLRDSIVRIILGHTSIAATFLFDGTCPFIIDSRGWSTTRSSSRVNATIEMILEIIVELLKGLISL